MLLNTTLTYNPTNEQNKQTNKPIDIYLQKIKIQNFRPSLAQRSFVFIHYWLTNSLIRLRSFISCTHSLIHSLLLSDSRRTENNTPQSPIRHGNQNLPQHENHLDQMILWGRRSRQTLAEKQIGYNCCCHT